MQWSPPILNGKSTDKALFCLYEDISFICVTYLFDLGLVLKLKFSFVIYSYIIYTLLFSRRKRSNIMQVLYIIIMLYFNEIHKEMCSILSKQ